MNLPKMRISVLCFSLVLTINSYAGVYAVIVGISQYSNKTMNLKFAAKDAQLFYMQLRTSNPGMPADNCTLLLNSHATQSNILEALSTQFSKAGKNDQVIFFFSGHGNKGLFFTYDSGNSLKYLYHKSLQDAFRRSQAGVKLCIADACFSGSLRPKASGNTVSLSQTSNKVIVFMSSRPNQRSYEMPALGSGLFVHYLLRSIKGEGDTNADRKISAIEMYQYIRENVTKVSKNNQTPQMFGKFSASDILVSY